MTLIRGRSVWSSAFLQAEWMPLYPLQDFKALYKCCIIIIIIICQYWHQHQLSSAQPRGVQEPGSYSKTQWSL